MEIVFNSIGIVQSEMRENQSPEKIRPVVSRIVFEKLHAGAAKELSAGQYLVVIYHLHRVENGKKNFKSGWLKSRTSERPNPIGVTLAQVVEIEGNAITVRGLDAVDGTPILDIKPYKPIFDMPPVAGEIVSSSLRRKVIVLTGGPGGGKSSLIEDLRKNPELSGKFVFLPETAEISRFVQISSKEKLFQRLMVNTQISLERGLDQTLGEKDRRAIVCHRGSLDPLAFWMKRGWPEEEFFIFTGFSRSEHYHRYACVLHLVTSAMGVPEHYTRWPHAHRPEEPEEAILLDRYLERAWGGHPHYFKIDNEHKDWKSKSKAAVDILKNFI
jgi:tRNA (Thr-GGU) A37 N-methylase